MSNLTTLIFDVDGTLADTERDGHRIAFNAAFAAAGLDWNWSVELYGELLTVTGGKERIRHYLDHYRRDFSRPVHFDSFVAELHAAKTKHYTEMLASGGLPLRQGVRRLLAEARDHGLRLAIATTTTPINVSALLQYSLASDSESWFEVIAAGDIVPKKKPAPDIYQFVLQTMDVRPHECIAIEDSGNGVRSALGAGVPAVVTVSDYCRNDNFAGAVLVVDQLGEPGHPFQLIAGDAGASRCVDVSLLRRLADGSA